VIVLGHGFWQERFGGDSKVLGRTLLLDAAPHTVIGVMPAGSTSRARPAGRVNYWVPFRIDPANASRGAHYFAVFGRLQDGVSLATAQAEMDTISRRSSSSTRTPTPTGW
jgi:putative ABC transport system permease protein